MFIFLAHKTQQTLALRVRTNQLHNSVNSVEGGSPQDPVPLRTHARAHTHAHTPHSHAHSPERIGFQGGTQSGAQYRSSSLIHSVCVHSRAVMAVGLRGLRQSLGAK